MGKKLNWKGDVLNCRYREIIHKYVNDNHLLMLEGS